MSLYGVDMIGNRWWLLVLAAYGSGLGAQTRPVTASASIGARLNELTAAERAAGVTPFPAPEKTS